MRASIMSALWPASSTGLNRSLKENSPCKPKFDVHGVICGGCTDSVQRALSKIDGVSHVDVSLRPGTATLEADMARVTPGQIEAAISSLGYRAKMHPADSEAGP